MIATLMLVVLVIVIAGVLVWGISNLPAIDPVFVQIARVLIIVAMVIAVAVLIFEMATGTTLVGRWR